LREKQKVFLGDVAKLFAASPLCLKGDTLNKIVLCYELKIDGMSLFNKEGGMAKP
jgi:hypothetical protein